MIIGGSTVYAGSMIGLYQVWYSNYPQTSFHFINDNKEWLQLDKCGHATTSYYVGVIGYNALKSAGLDEKKAVWYGGSLGFAYLTVIEILDGFSKEWGASGGDLMANTFGSAAFISQQLLWHEQRLMLKWSYYPTSYPVYRPEVLGRTSGEQIIKDYNGHTYWISANIKSFLPEPSRFPGWVNLAVGYGGEGMTGGTSNPLIVNGVTLPDFNRTRHFYLSPDIDLTRIPVHSKTLRFMLKVAGFIKFPMPALEFSKSGVKIHALYF